MKNALFFIWTISFTLTAIQTIKAQHSNGMFSDKAAIRWQDALVSGNGEMGILVFGDPGVEKVIFNHEMLYEPIGTENIEPPDIAKYLPETRRLIAEEKYADATEYSLQMAKKEGYPGILWTDPYHPAFAMKINQKGKGKVRDYKRSLDFTNGQIKVEWQNGSGKWERNAFVSRADQVVVQEIRSRNKKKINATITLDFQNSNKKRISAKGGELNVKAPEIHAEESTITYRSSYTLDDRGYEAVTKVINRGGEVIVVGNSLQISQADYILLFTKIEPLEDFNNSSIEEIKNALNALPVDYDVLLKKHAKIHGDLFGRISVNLSEGNSPQRSSETMIAEQKKMEDEIDLELLETMFNMGRYAFISSSGNNPPNLMGIWNGEWRPAWSGDFTLDANINLQISAANLGNLPEGIQSYTRLLERVAPDWEVNAKNLFGARGYLSGTRTSGRRNLHTHFSTNFPGHFWTSGAEWLLYPSFEYFLTSGDTAFLERIYPMMKKTALFFEDFLTEVDENGKYIFTPSYSPENHPLDQESGTTVNASMDIASTKELLTNLIYSARILGIDSTEIPKWQGMIAKLPPYLINEDGALKEWAHASLQDNYDHRHVSHLYPVWPGLEINPDEDLEIYNAALKAADLRGRGNGSAHGLSHMALIGTRLKQADLVYGNLQFMMSKHYLYTSLFTSHNPGRIYNADMLCSLPSVMMEMLIFSKPGEIELLPALSEKIESGSITGIKCRTFATVDQLEWDYSKGRCKAEISSLNNQTIKITYRKGIKSMKVNGKNMDLEEINTTGIELDFKTNEKKVVDIVINQSLQKHQ